MGCQCNKKNEEDELNKDSPEYIKDEDELIDKEKEGNNFQQQEETDAEKYAGFKQFHG